MRYSLLLPMRDKPGIGLRASKWLSHAVLLDTSEIEKLIAELGTFWIFPLGGLIPRQGEEITKEEFVTSYSRYISSIKAGKRPEEELVRRCFTSAWTVSLDHLYAVPISASQEIIKIERPVVQLQYHLCDYSPVDGKFRSMVFGADSISWGIQFSYPQLYQDKQHETYSVDENPDFPNTAFFRKLQRWIRQHTIPTPFLVDGKRVNVPIRLGKECLPWINNHPQLASKGLSVLYTQKSG